jgi:hypothetical protein
VDRTLDADRASDARRLTGSTKQEAGPNRPASSAFDDTKKCRLPRSGWPRWASAETSIANRTFKRAFVWQFGRSVNRYSLLFPGPAGPAEAADAAAAAVRQLGAQPPGGISWEALGRQLLRAASVAWSRTEGLEISYRRLACADFGQVHSDLTAESVLGNVAAMEAAVALGGRSRPLTTRDAVLGTEERLLNAAADVDETSGDGGAGHTGREPRAPAQCPCTAPMAREELAGRGGYPRPIPSA